MASGTDEVVRPGVGSAIAADEEAAGSGAAPSGFGGPVPSQIRRRGPPSHGYDAGNDSGWWGRWIRQRQGRRQRCRHGSGAGNGGLGQQQRLSPHADPTLVMTTVGRWGRRIQQRWRTVAVSSAPHGSRASDDYGGRWGWRIHRRRAFWVFYFYFFRDFVVFACGRHNRMKIWIFADLLAHAVCMQKSILAVCKPNM